MTQAAPVDLNAVVTVSDTGHGLASARAVVEGKHHGELTFESEVGAGTTFTLRLPIGGPRDRDAVRT